MNEFTCSTPNTCPALRLHCTQNPARNQAIYGSCRRIAPYMSRIRDAPSRDNEGFMWDAPVSHAILRSRKRDNTNIILSRSVPTRSRIQAYPISNTGPPDLEYRLTRSRIQAHPISNTGSPDLEYRPTRSRIQAHPISNRGPSDLEYRPTRSWIQAQPISNRGPPDLEYRPTRSWIQAQPIMNTGPPNLYLDTSVSDPLSFFTDLDPDLDPTQNQRILAESWQKFKVSKFLSFFLNGSGKK